MITQTGMQTAAQENSDPTHLGIDILQVRQPVGAILGIADVVLGDLLVAPRRQEDAVHEVGDGGGIVGLVLVVPFSRDLVGGVARGKDVGCWRTD